MFKGNPSFTWPMNKKKPPPMDTSSTCSASGHLSSPAKKSTQQRQTQHEPRRQPGFSLLASLDENYARQNSWTSSADASTIEMSPRIGSTVASKMQTNSSPEDALLEVVSETPPDAVRSTPNESSNSDPPSQMLQNVSDEPIACSSHDADNDDDNCSAISATPPTPPAEQRRRSAVPSGHKRQSKISEFLNGKRSQS